MAPSPNRFHQRVSSNIEFLIRQWIESGAGEGRVCSAPFDVYLDNENVFQPDILYIRPDNYGIITDAGCEGAPDLIIEILSLRTRSLDLGPKKKIFAGKEVKEMWIIDPDPLTVAVYDLEKDVETPRHSCGETDTLQPVLLSGLDLSAARIFAD